MSYKRFYGPALLPSTATDLYEVPGGKRIHIKHIHVSNPSASTVDLTLSIGSDAALTRIYDDHPVPPDGILMGRDYDLWVGEKLQGYASSAATLNITISGQEWDVTGGWGEFAWGDESYG